MSFTPYAFIEWDVVEEPLPAPDFIPLADVIDKVGKEEANQWQEL